MEMYIDLTDVSEQAFARFQGLCFSRGIYWGISGIDAEAEKSVFRKRHLTTASIGLKLVKQMINYINIDCDVVYQKEIIGNIHENTELLELR